MERDHTGDTPTSGLKSIPRGDRPPSDFLVVVSGPRMGSFVELQADRVDVGRSPSSALRFEADSVSRHHAVLERSGDDWTVRDLGSTNGTWVDDARVSSAPVPGGARLRFGDIVLKMVRRDDVEAPWLHLLLRQATTDALTGLANRRALFDFLDKEVARARRYGRHLSVVMMDVDRFKDVNDHHGHSAGDAVLRAIAEAARNRLRRESLFARYGGDEFVLVLPETDAEAARQVASGVRKAIQDLDVPYRDQVLHVTGSLGVATFDAALHGSPEDLLLWADRSLLEAKAEGRNAVRSGDEA